MANKLNVTASYLSAVENGKRAAPYAWESIILSSCPLDERQKDEDYIGEYTVGVNEVVVLEEGMDDSVEIYENAIEISLICIPQRIEKPDGTVLWERK